MYTLEQLLRPDTYARLQAEAVRTEQPLAALVQQAMDQFLASGAVEAADDEAEITSADQFRESLRDIKAGRTRPAREAVDEIRRRYADGS